MSAINTTLLVKLCPLLSLVNQASRRYTKRFRHLEQHTNDRLSFASLNHADKCSINVGGVRQLLLREPSVLACNAQPQSECQAWIQEVRLIIGGNHLRWTDVRLVISWFRTEATSAAEVAK